MRIIIHIGYPRTGTTFLQTNVFPIHRDINFLGPKNYLDLKDKKITSKDLNLISIMNNEYDLNNNKITKIDKDLLKFLDEKKVNVLSFERYTNYRNIINDFKDLKYLEILISQNFKDVKFDFIVVLRNQYDLIKSYYYHNYSLTSVFLGIKDFKSIYNFLDTEILEKYSNFPLKLFLHQYDFYQLHNKLLNRFKNSKIKYLFYEDLKFDNKHFSDEFASFLNLNKKNMEKLFNSEIVNNRRVKLNKDYYMKTYMYKFLNSKVYLFLKNYIPFKNLSKKLILNNFIYSSAKYTLQEESLFRNKVKRYYKDSNVKFFEQSKISNKYNY